MPKIYDNIENHLTKGLNETLKLSSRADFCVGYFNLRGWGEIADRIESLTGNYVQEGEEKVYRYCRLLVGMQRLPFDLLQEAYNRDDSYLLDQAEALRLKKRLAMEFREQLTVGTPDDTAEKYLRILSRQLKDKKVVVRLHLSHPLHAKLYLAYSEDSRVPIIGFLGSSNLTMSGLLKQGELNVDVLEQDAAYKLSKWFYDRWTDRWSIDITKELIEVIDESWAADRLTSPYHIYLKIAYHLSREARAGISEFKIPKVFENELLEFQKKAVLVAAHHLNRYKNRPNGVLIGDVVGLGKTMVATALAKVLEEDFFTETLIICPKNLVEMWECYVYKYKLHAKIISQSKVQKDLPNMRRYRVVIIDESHNLRNDSGSRYRAIKEYLEENESRVILLSATPYNKSYKDLSNQLRLFLADDADLGLMPERYVQSIGGQIMFEAKHTETFIRSIKAFERSDFADDWRELMRLFLVRRTRSFIKNNYAEPKNGPGRKYLTFSNGTRSYFPDRIPKKVEYHFNPNDRKDQYARLYSDKVVNLINDLELPRYGLGNYIIDKPARKLTKDEEVMISNLSRAGKRLMGFCRTNLFKRLESSGYAFLLSIARHLLRNFVFIHAMENRLDLPIGKNVVENLDDFLEDNDMDQDDNTTKISFLVDENEFLRRASEVYNIFSHTYSKNFLWLKSDLVKSDLTRALIEDCRILLKILKLAEEWKPELDRKLNALVDLLTVKHEHDKVLVFTQYADTAHYLGHQLSLRNVQKYAVVTGDEEHPTLFAQRFSPVSNDKPELVGTQDELRILITTDVLSEGQNLQDCHIILNYDLPWAIIRLIQRAGRVDRIGQKAEEILCYSFLPEDGLENIIRLRSRLTTRIRQNSEVVGSDETFFDGDPINISDLYSEKSGILDEDDDAEIDLASYAYQIWKNALDKDPSLAKKIPDMPNVVYGTTVNKHEKENEGVIVYARTAEDTDALAWLDKKGRLITQSPLTILKAAECTPETEPKPRLDNHHALVKKAVEIIKSEEFNAGGALGKKSSVKYRVYMRLDRYCKENEGTIWVTAELKKAVDDIYKYPLKEYARDTLSRQLKAGISDEALSELVVSLRDDDKLCIKDVNEQSAKQLQIICSLGLRPLMENV